jgi:uncharacterized protein YeaC (DUF1315 family)
MSQLWNISKNSLTDHHTSSQECKHYAKSKAKSSQERIQESAKNVIFLWEQKKYQEHHHSITCNDDNLPAVEAQLKKARQPWARTSKTIKKQLILM